MLALHFSTLPDPEMLAGNAMLEVILKISLPLLMMLALLILPVAVLNPIPSVVPAPMVVGPV